MTEKWKCEIISSHAEWEKTLSMPLGADNAEKVRFIVRYSAVQLPSSLAPRRPLNWRGWL